MIFGLLGFMIFGIPAMLVASKKGFADGRWLFALGLIGFVTVCFLPSARSSRISHRTARDRRESANGVGAVLCGINLIAFVAYALIHTFVESGMRG